MYQELAMNKTMFFRNLQVARTISLSHTAGPDPLQIILLVVYLHPLLDNILLNCSSELNNRQKHHANVEFHLFAVLWPPPFELHFLHYFLLSFLVNYYNIIT